MSLPSDTPAPTQRNRGSCGAHRAPREREHNVAYLPTVAQFTAGGGSLAVFNENENAGTRTARGGKAGLGGVPKRALQDVTNATQQAGIVGKKQVSAYTSAHRQPSLSPRCQLPPRPTLPPRVSPVPYFKRPRDRWQEVLQKKTRMNRAERDAFIPRAARVPAPRVVSSFFKRPGVRAREVLQQSFKMKRA